MKKCALNAGVVSARIPRQINRRVVSMGPGLRSPSMRCEAIMMKPQESFFRPCDLHRCIIGTARRQLAERARRGADLILELASGKRLVLVENALFHSPTSRSSFPAWTCAAYG